MAGRDIIVVGTSTGGVEALVELARGLPPGFPASVFVVCHFPPGGRSVLPEILSRAGPLTAKHAADGEPFYPGHIYVAPPDRHMLLAPGGRVRLTRDARENHFRPAVDPLFRSAARHYGDRVIGVILTGALYDGSAGLIAIRTAGGVSVVQDLNDALVAAMPQNATQLAGADHTVPISGLAALLVKLVRDRSALETRGDPMSADAAPVGGSDPIEKAAHTVEETMAAQSRNERRGQVAPFTCPECGGSLWQVDEPRLIQFRCHVGHAYNGEALLAEQSEALEAALWTAVRTFREKSVLGRQMADAERRKGAAATAARFDEQAEQAERYAALIVEHVLQGNGGNQPVQNSTP
ncbi:MAG: chemotaxis protein CheB [Planctomycetes bacterium]|nr:chemotaxis protein CheB [Planctomycetota bacterium]